MGVSTWQTSNRLDIGNRLWYTPGRPCLHQEKLVAAMVSAKKWFAGQFKPGTVAFLLVLFGLGLGFFAWNAHLELALDDIGWLNGEAPTVFDRYRYIPRFLFTSFHALVGPNAVAALTMIFTVHVINTLLVYRLCQKLLGSLVAARTGAVVFFVNPITLATLTWISCFSYVVGTLLALVSLLAFWKSITESNDSPLLWWGVALACYVAALFCSHEVFFLPLIFLLLCWLRGTVEWKPGIALFSVALALAWLINRFVYDFEQYGVETMQLFTPGFFSALVSSVLSFGASLALAYPLSFAVKPTEFLRISFAEPLRWAITLLLLAVAILAYRRTRAWRIWMFLALSFAAVIAPYVIRLYLTPDSVSYHISGILSGRVFYLPFVIIAMVLGLVVGKLVRRANSGLALCLLITVAYLHAVLVLYDKTDFMGLQVLQGETQHLSPSWTPYADSQPVWLIGLLLVTLVTVTCRLLAEHAKGDEQ
jgi:hypothetical protein